MTGDSRQISPIFQLSKCSSKIFEIGVKNNLVTEIKTIFISDALYWRSNNCIIHYILTTSHTGQP